MKHEILGIIVSDSEFDDLMCKQASGMKLVVENNKVIAVDNIPSFKDRIFNQISELKKLLNETDYKAIKFAEGFITKEEYEPIKLQRMIWREEINELEKQIK